MLEKYNDQVTVIEILDMYGNDPESFFKDTSRKVDIFVVNVENFLWITVKTLIPNMHVFLYKCQPFKLLKYQCLFSTDKLKHEGLFDVILLSS